MASVNSSSRRSAKDLIALIFRVEKSNCRQYPFFDQDSLSRFCARAPYRDELLKIQRIENAKLADSFYVVGRDYQAAEGR